MGADNTYGEENFNPKKCDRFEMKRLGTPRSIGALKKMIEYYTDETPFGFRNQPIQELVEVKHDDDVFVCFQ